MGHIVFGNFGESTLDSDITSTATTFDVQAGEGANFPAITGGNYYYLTIVNISADREIVKATGLSTDTFTVVRAQEGTTAMAFSADDKVHYRATAAMFTEIAEYPERTSVLTIETATDTPMGVENDNSSGNGYIICNDEASALAGSFGHKNSTSKLTVQAESGIPIVIDSDTSHTVTGDLDVSGTVACVDVEPTGDIYLGDKIIFSGRNSYINSSAITYTELVSFNPTLITITSASVDDMAFVSCSVRLSVARDTSNPSWVGMKLYEKNGRATFAYDSDGLYNVHDGIGTTSSNVWYNFSGVMTVQEAGVLVMSVGTFYYPLSTTEIQANYLNLCVEWLKKE